MSTNVDARFESTDDRPISGPYYEPPEQGGLAYWRCDRCGDEAIEKRGLEDNCKCARSIRSGREY